MCPAALSPAANARHLFSDESLPDYDGTAAALLKQRVLAFLARIDAPA